MSIKLLQNEIHDSECLFRAVHPNPNYWHRDSGRLTTAALKNGKDWNIGISVDRSYDRSESTVIHSMKNTWGSDYHIASISVKILRKITHKDEPEKAFDVIYDPVLDENKPNIYHCLIIRRPSGDLTKSYLRTLTKYLHKVG